MSHSAIGGLYHQMLQYCTILYCTYSTFMFLLRVLSKNGALQYIKTFCMTFCHHAMINCANVLWVDMKHYILQEWSHCQIG